MSQRSSSNLRRAQSRSQIAVGLVGVGAMWERRYRPAVARLRDRISIRVVYDAVLARAQLTAAEYGADVATGLRQLFERHDLHAVLVLDPAWYDLFPAELSCEHRMPVFLAGALGTDREALNALHARSEERETLLMTEFSRRYTPATNRLRELIATRLGEARQISVAAQIPQSEIPGTLPGQSCERDYLAGLLDWCQYITGRIPTSVRSLPTSEIAQASPAHAAQQLATDDFSKFPWSVELGFRPDAGGYPASKAILHLCSSELARPVDPESGDDWPFPTHEILCQHGRALIREAGEIHWQNGTTQHLGTERLAAERSDAEVMLDQFSRRVRGGLVPVANLRDVCRALAMVEAAEHSRRSGELFTPKW